jgi:K+-sensing histidine kinase KdpD
LNYPKPENKTILMVKDEGEGISDEDKKAVLQKFYPSWG